MSARPDTQGPAVTAVMANVWARRAMALLVLGVAGAIAWWATHLPLAAPVSGQQSWTINAGDEVTLIGPNPGRVLSFEGAVGKGVGVRFGQATIAAETAQALAFMGVAPLSAGPAPIQWITHDGGDSRATLALDFQPSGPHPTLSVGLTSGDGVAEVAFQAQDAQLRVTMSGPLVGPMTPDADVLVGATPIKLGQAAFPMTLEVAPKQMFTVRFAQSAAGGARFDWGQVVNPLQRITVLNVAGVRVARPGETDPIYACGSKPQAIAWRSTDVAKLACQPTLRLQGLDLAPEGGNFKIVGSAFLLQRGEATVMTWDKVRSTPVVSSVGGAAYGGLVTWIIRSLLGRPAGPRATEPAASAPGPKRTRRRQAA